MNFDEYSKTFLHFHSDEIPRLLKSSLTNGDDVEVLVDMGAGDGALLVGLQRGGYLSEIKEVIGVDLSQDRCDRLSLYTGFKIYCADVTNVTQLKDASVDFIICTQVIEHVDQYELLDEFNRVLKKNGRVYLASIIKKWYGWWYYKTKEGKWGMDPTHLREYESVEQFESVITKASFSIIDTEVSSLKLSLLEFIVRRVVVPIFKPANVNSIFTKVKFIDWLRRKVNIHPPGYFIVESIIVKK